MENKYKKRLLYLCGAPRISTLQDTSSAGPKSHIEGIISGFIANGWNVDKYILGNHLKYLSKNQSKENLIKRNEATRYIADLVRLLAIGINKILLMKHYHTNYNLVYERYSLFQQLGFSFKKMGIKWVVESNAVLSSESKFDRKSSSLYKFSKQFEKNTYQNCDYLIVVSNILKDMIIREFCINEEKIFVVPNAVDTEIYNPLKTTAIRLTDDFVIGFVGALYSWHGLDILINSVSKLRDDHNIKIKVVIVGDGPELSNLKTLAKKNHLENEIIFVGRVNQIYIPQYIKGFDICFNGHIKLINENSYTSPLKLYEYLAMNKNVVIHQNNIVGDKNMYKFALDTNSEFELVNVLHRAYNNRILLNNVDLKLRDFVQNYHTWFHRVLEIKKIIGE